MPLSATADLFLTVAKFRAVRLLWARALEAAGADALAQPTVLAEMSTRILAAYDPHVNLLRGTAAAFAASVGGANAVAVHAFDAVRGAQTAFSNRLARNTGLVLQHEAYLAAVADASAGSAYVERLTDELASRAWSLFQSVEAKGGLLEALATGFVHGAIEKVAQSRSAAIARRERKITGVSAFPDLAECIKPALRQTVRRKAADETDTKAPVAALPLPGQGVRFTALVAAAKDGASLARLRALAHRVAEPLRRALPPKTRDAEPFELLRRRSDIALDRIGSRPPVFLATFGKPEEHRARASWVQSFFAVGGIQTVEADESVEGVAAIAAAFKKSPAPIACLCASNAAYEAMPDLASALKEAGATFVYLAAPPKVLARLADRYASAVDRLIYEGCDALALLQEAHRILKVDELAEAAVDEEEPGFDDTNGTGFREGPSMDLTR